MHLEHFNFLNKYISTKILAAFRIGPCIMVYNVSKKCNTNMNTKWIHGMYLYLLTNTERIKNKVLCVITFTIAYSK